MQITWESHKAVLGKDGSLTEIEAGTPFDMPDDEAVQRIEQGDCKPVNQAEFDAAKAKRDAALAAVSPAPDATPEPAPAPPPAPAVAAPKAKSADPTPAPGDQQPAPPGGTV